MQRERQTSSVGEKDVGWKKGVDVASITPSAYHKEIKVHMFEGILFDILDLP
jgi:hypothetical protein